MGHALENEKNFERALQFFIQATQVQPGKALTSWHLCTPVSIYLVYLTAFQWICFVSAEQQTMSNSKLIDLGFLETNKSPPEKVSIYKKLQILSKLFLV